MQPWDLDMKQRVLERMLLPLMPLLQVHMMAKLLTLVLELAHNMLPLAPKEVGRLTPTYPA